jgi:uncharacterized protein YbaR (Trm112 family)
MKSDLVNILACPEDKAMLTLRVTEESEPGHVQTGTLTCTQCGFEYPIEEGIPNLLPQAMHVDGVQDSDA